jgi:chromosome segregation ATPase
MEISDDARREQELLNAIDNKVKWMKKLELRGTLREHGRTPYVELFGMYEALFHLNHDPVAFDAAIENINKAIQLVEREWNQDASKFEYIAKRARFYIDAQKYDEATTDTATLRYEMSRMPEKLASARIEDAELQHQFKSQNHQLIELRKQKRALDTQLDELNTRFRTLNRHIATNKLAIEDATVASKALTEYVESLDKKLASRFESSVRSFTGSPQRGGRSSRTQRSTRPSSFFGYER